MGKASRWIRKLLLGKKEDNINIKDRGDGGGGGESPPSFTTIVPATPRRRWNFRRSNDTQKLVVNHKSCRSFDSILTSQLVSQALFDYAILQRNHGTTMLAVPPPKATTKTVYRLSHMAAATKIQAVFRSYLARKALCALRGLVKLQALVRGHLVRKRTSTMIRCMSALVAIQVRARFQRVQMADDAKSRSHLGEPSTRGFVMSHERRSSEPLFDYNENMGQFGSKRSTSINYRQPSRRFSIDLSPQTRETSTRLHSKPANTTSQTSTQHGEPNYMTRTESSRAKARSHSEPRQRPTKQKRENRRTSSNEGLSTKLHGSPKSINNFEFDSASTCTNSSSYYTNLYAYEVSTS